MGINGRNTETFRLTGVSSHADALKKLASANPDWNLSPEEIVEAGKADQKIYRLRFNTKPVELKYEPNNSQNSIAVIVAGHRVGYIRPEDFAHVKDILDNCNVQNISCGIWGGQCKVITEFFEVENQKQPISVIVRISYQSWSAPMEDALDFDFADDQPTVTVKKGKPLKQKKLKKSIFKRWWFWAIIIFFIIGMFGGGETSDNDTPGTLPSETSASAVSQQPTETRSIADVETDTQETISAIDSESTEADSNISLGMKNALQSAESYLDFTAFSYSGLIEQLEFEGYTTDEATYAVDNCGADWFEQALLSAESYLDYTAFSYSGLVEQLEFEGFTNEQATYAVDSCGADWFEQAAKSAESYLQFTSFSRAGLIEQLEYEGFTNEQAVYGVEQNGY